MNKTLAVELQDLREEIAQEIEKLLCDSNCLGVNQEHCDNIKESIAVVRGKK